jgi:hypothetical protein
MKIFRDVLLGIIVGSLLALMLSFGIWPFGDKNFTELMQSTKPTLMNYSQ